MARVRRETREPTDEEREILRARSERRRDSTVKHTPTGDTSFLAVLGVLVAVGAPFFLDGPVRYVIIAFGLSIAVIGVQAWRKQRRRLAERLEYLDAEAQARAAEVTELRFAARRALAVTDPHGDGETYWLLALDAHEHLVLAGSQWDPADEPPEVWRRQSSVVLDGAGIIVRLQTEGDAIGVERRDVRAPDFEVTDAHRFWEPPEGVPLPGVVRAPRPVRLDEIDPEAA